MNDRGLALDGAVFSAVPPHLVRRPDGMPWRATAGAVPWEQRTLRRAVGMRAEPESVQIAAVLTAETCTGWPVTDLRPIAVECASALVTGAVIARPAADGADGHDLFLLLSVAGASLIIEACDPETGWWSSEQPWEYARTLAVQAGGEFGLAHGPNGRCAFIALPLPPLPVEALDEWALGTVTSAEEESR